MAQDDRTEWIWRDGEFIRWEDAHIHIISHVAHYGSSVFEGIRFYETDRGSAVFRLADHMRRLHHSCRIYRMPLRWSVEDLSDASIELIRRNGISEGYLRPLVIRGEGARGVNPQASAVQTFLMSWPWGQYLGTAALQDGVDVCVSSWSRPAPNTHPVLAKAGGNYVNNQLMKMEAVANGYAEAIALSPDGLVSEGSGQNLFLVDDGALLTPPQDGTILQGITRGTILWLAERSGIPVREVQVPRERLYVADELFFTGTAAEVTPIRSVDRILVGEGVVGPVTRTLQSAYLDLVRGRSADPHGWRTDVARRRRAGAA